MAELKHVSMKALTAGLGGVRQSPATIGVLELIVRRPRTDVREVVEVAELDVIEGLVGDGWKTRGSSKTDDGSAELERQLTVTNARLMALVAREKRHWPPAGDQLYVDFDLSADNAPSGTRLSIGAAVIQVTETPHTGVLRPELSAIAVPATAGGLNMTPADFSLTAGWGHYGTGGAVMPGQGHIKERAYTSSSAEGSAPGSIRNRTFPRLLSDDGFSDVTRRSVPLQLNAVIYIILYSSRL